MPINSVTKCAQGHDGSLKPPGLSRNIVARPAGHKHVATGTGAAPAAYPLKHATWHQAKGEVEQVVVSVTYTSPASCGGGFSFNTVNTFVNGVLKGSAFLNSTPVSTKQTVVSTFTLPAPSKKTKNVLTAQASDGCSGAAENFTVGAVSVDALGFR